MKNLFEEFQKVVLESNPEALLMQILMNNPIGTIILNEKYEIVYINDATKKYFENELDLNYDSFGNIFKCENILHESKVCGTIEQCKNCKLRSAVIYCSKNECGVCRFKFGRKFLIKNRLVEKWFDIYVQKLMIGHTKYLWLSMNDITDLIKYKFEAGINNIHSDEYISNEKSLFHESVIKYIERLDGTDNVLVFTQIRFSNLAVIKEQFGNLWFKDYFTSYYRLIREKMNIDDIICRCSQESLLLFWQFPVEKEVNEFISAINNYEHEMFRVNNSIKIRMIKVKISNKKIEMLKDTDSIYAEYMKLLNRISNKVNIDKDSNETIILDF